MPKYLTKRVLLQWLGLLFIAYQIAGALILLYNFDIIIDFFWFAVGPMNQGRSAAELMEYLSKLI